MIAARLVVPLLVASALALFGCSSSPDGGAGGPDSPGASASSGPGSSGGGAPAPDADGGVATGGGDGGAPAPTDACSNIAPAAGGDAKANATTIQGCLDHAGHARLLAGTFPIASALQIPAGAELAGAGAPTGANRPTIVLARGNTGNMMVSLHGLAAGAAPLPAGVHTHVAHLRLDAANAIGSLANASTVLVGSDDALVEDVDITNTTQGPEAYTTAAVYFICQACKGNVFSHVAISNHYYGVIFRNTLTKATPNRVADSEISNIRCDSVTFAGYGEAVNDVVHDTGWACNNGPIPGGGFYTLENPNGGLIMGNTIHDTCGHGLDMDRSSHFVIEGNHVYDPGSRFGGKYPYCGGNAAFLLDVSETTVTGNTFENSGRTYNSGFDSNQVMHAVGAAPFSDLPNGASTVIAFVLAHRPNGAGDMATHDTITGNTFHAYVDPASGFVGLGYFTSRGTGYDAGGAWSAATTNYWQANTPFGSNVGSMRCGGDWFAGSSTCVAGSPAPCNTDDYQHTGTFHSDACSMY